MTRARTVAAVERFMARKAPAGHWPIDARFAHVTVAGCAVYCAACETHGRLPLPRAEGYGPAVEDFLERHRLCAAAGEGAKP